MNRTFTRIDSALEAYVSDCILRTSSNYIDAVLLHTTPRDLSAMASRLSHESMAKANPTTDAMLLDTLLKAGDEHSKSLRGHLYYFLIEAPRYFWPEIDTYTVGVISMGSTSTMHREAKNLTGDELVRVKSAITEDTLQARMKVISEPTLRRIIHQRHNHRLPEWQHLCKFFERALEVTT